jgi:hypothetical protein
LRRGAARPKQKLISNVLIDAQSPTVAGTNVADGLFKRVPSNRTRNNIRHAKETFNMVWTILVILLVLWLLGLVSGYTIGGFVHILLVLALVIFIINLLTGRRAV